MLSHLTFTPFSDYSEYEHLSDAHRAEIVLRLETVSARYRDLGYPIAEEMAKVAQLVKENKVAPYAGCKRMVGVPICFPDDGRAKSYLEAIKHTPPYKRNTK